MKTTCQRNCCKQKKGKNLLAFWLFLYELPFNRDLSENSLNCSCTTANEALLEWLHSLKGPRQPGDTRRWMSLINGHNTQCSTPEHLKGTRLDQLTVGDICNWSLQLIRKRLIHSTLYMYAQYILLYFVKFVHRFSFRKMKSISIIVSYSTSFIP